jgi:hypothetical protein
VLAIFTITIFLGAAMLFLVQPMIAKMVLPLLGGSPSVWNTCMVFFQALLLAGYAYAHYSVKLLGLRRQIVLHLVVISLPLLLWPAGIPPIAKPGSTPGPADAPVPWLLAMLLICIGPAFFVLSTCSTLMQRWFTDTGHAAAKDPYFLYIASNAGSMLALLAYPLLVEPWVTLPGQRLLWSIGYAALAGATVVCAVLAGRTPLVAVANTHTPAHAPAPPWSTRARWIALAAVPSSLMLAITQYLSTDIAAIPLLWIVPLAIYLITFVLAFAKKPLIPIRVSNRTLPILVLALAVIVLLARRDPIWIIIVLNLATLFFGAMLCHGQLAQSRPDPAHLTAFYLCLALGGVLGGLFNVLAAPMLFDTLLEYPIVLAAACWLRPSGPRIGPRWQRIVTDVGFAMLPVVIASLPTEILRILRNMGLISGPLNDTTRMALLIGLPVLACYALVGVPRRFAIGVAALIIVNAAFHSRHADAEVRTFFGLYTVQRTATPQGREVVELLHGTTLHGAQWADPSARTEPLIYYHRSGPVGDVFSAFGHTPLFDRVALVGLGAGTIAAYGRDGQTLTFYEIDPAVVRLSRDSGLFHYVRDSKARCEFAIGDARISLAREADGTYGAIVLDAFSSDAVPVHLLTREAVDMYISKLKPGGIIALHVSNRYLELERVVSGVVQDLGLHAAIRDDTVPEDESDQTLYWSSTWVAVARAQEDLAPLLARKRWKVLTPDPADRVWTDDYSSFVGIFQWNRSR